MHESTPGTVTARSIVDATTNATLPPPTVVVSVAERVTITVGPRRQASSSLTRRLIDSDRVRLIAFDHAFGAAGVADVELDVNARRLGIGGGLPGQL